LATFFAAEVTPALTQGFEPSYNIPPTRSVPALTLEAGSRRLDAYSWGLVPSWARDRSIGPKTFNARAESVAVKPTFRAAFRTRRCIIPADPGFYEWSKDPRELRTPYLFARRDGEPMAFAGLWEVFRAGRDEPWTRSCTIITTEAGGDVAPVHGRQPVILERASWDRWLDPGLHDRDELEALLVPGPAGSLVRRRVSSAVGDPHNDRPELVEAVDS
jgi:putative SOS response-associated peptidase YedK